ncbi:hypothetical protein Tco_0769848 [Tanacetum coccineum]|uniref:Uncharacterized protein n=1 Tax=Tanacetum coccineum TaxID=301880 RepID=A0ABQ4ZBH3_9ASTR
MFHLHRPRASPLLVADMIFDLVDIIGFDLCSSLRKVPLVALIPLVGILQEHELGTSPELIGSGVNSPGPAPNLLTPGPISSGLVPNHAPAIPYVPPTNKELEMLFQPMFDGYFNPLGIRQDHIPNVAQDSVIPTGPFVSIAIDLDAPSGSHTSLPLDHHSSSVHHGVAGEQYAEVNPFAAADPEPFVNMFAPDYNSEASSSGEITIPESNQSTLPQALFPERGRFHPLDNIIGNPSRPVSTRKQLATDALIGKSKKAMLPIGKDGVYRVLPPTTQEEQFADEKERKARTLLLMAVPKDHLRRFHGMDDAKEIWAAIKTRFGGNANSKKMQKAVLKQQFEAFTISSKESLEKGYDRFQKLLSQLDALGAGVSDEDEINKFLRSLPPAWDSLAMTMRTKKNIDTLSIDDLYN